MADKWPKTETELCKPIISWLIDMKWEVYQEVQIQAFGAIADIVAVQNKITWIIEAKRTLSLSLLGQAADWICFANYISIATPRTKSNRQSAGVVFDFLKRYGIGRLIVSQEKNWRKEQRLEYEVEERVPAKLHRAASRGKNWIRDSLCEEHKTFAEAGNSDGLRYSPFKGTCKALANFVQNNPGATLKETIEGIQHHYATAASARGSLSKWIRLGKVAGIELRKERGKVYLYPAGGND